jgi:hypothetical protein
MKKSKNDTKTDKLDEVYRLLEGLQGTQHGEKIY